MPWTVSGRCNVDGVENMRMLLESSGHEMHVAHTGNAAMDWWFREAHMKAYVEVRLSTYRPPRIDHRLTEPHSELG